MLKEIKNKLNTKRHSELDSASQQGRSMVEMLGVLAVVGVLSVAGITAYSTAMTKHRANELLYEASKRATVVAMQVASGKKGNQLSVAEFGDNNWSVTTDGLTNQFGIVSPSTSTDVCKQVVNSVGTGSAIKQVLSGTADVTNDASNCSDNTVTLVYNNDLSNGMNGSNTPPEPQTINCPSGTGTDRTTYTGNPFTYTEGTASITCYCPDGKMWDGEDCDTDCVTSGTCSNNQGLCVGYYCEVLGNREDCENDVGYKIEPGQVEPIQNPTPITTEGTKTYYTSGSRYMTWDAAYYYCEAVGIKEGKNISMVSKDASNLPVPSSLCYWANSLNPSGTTPSSNSCYAAFIWDEEDEGVATIVWDSRDEAFDAGCYALCE